MRKRYMRLIVILVVGLGLWGWWYRTPRQIRVRPANVGAKSFSVGWFSKKPSRGCVMAVESWKFKSWKDWVIKCDDEKTQWHLVDFKGVKPGTEYQLVVMSGLRVTFKNILSVKTKEISDQPPLIPKPAYGNVVDQKGNPVEGVLVYITAEAKTFNYPVAGVTNRQGNYGIDVGELSQISESLVLDAVGSRGYWKELLISTEGITPAPTITVANK